MTDTGIHGAGATLKFSPGTATEATIALGQITSIGLPGISVDDIDISTMDSADKWRSFIPGMKDGGDLSVDFNFDKANFSTASFNLLGNIGVAGIIQIQVNDAVIPTNGSKLVFPGYLKAMGGTIPFETKVTQTVTVKVAGKPTFTAGG